MIKMKIKTRIISYTFLSCFIVISVLSSFIYIEMKEIVVQTLDSNASEVEKSLFHLITSEDKSIDETVNADEYAEYYINISYMGESYASTLGRQFAPPQSGKKKFVSELYPVKGDGYTSKTFRFIRYDAVHAGSAMSILIGIPLDGIEEELNELFVSVSVSTVVSVIIISLLGVFIANTILKPVQDIVKASGNINSRNLSGRIKVPASRDEIYDLTMTLNSLFDRLEKSFNLQKEFIADISHEIKTPLTIMNIATDTAMQEAAENDSEDKYLFKMYNNLNRLNKLVKDIINLSYIETNQLASVEDIPLREVVEDITENFSEMIEEKGIRLSCLFEGEGVVRGEYRLIYSAVTNLIHNAVKYNVTGGYIQISVCDADGKTELKVENSCNDNSGVDTDRIFDRFYRAEKSRSREYGGAGLGLSIVKEIVMKHNGSVTVYKADKKTISFIMVI